MGVADGGVFVCEDGDQLVLEDDGVKRLVDEVPAGYLYVDGIIGDVGAGVLRDRRVLAEEGVVVVVVDRRHAQTGAIITGPEIITRGWVYAPEAEDLLDQCAEAVRDRSRRRSVTAASTSRRCSARSDGPRASSSTSRPSAAR